MQPSRVGVEMNCPLPTLCMFSAKDILEAKDIVVDDSTAYAHGVPL